MKKKMMIAGCVLIIAVCCMKMMQMKAEIKTIADFQKAIKKAGDSAIGVMNAFNDAGDVLVGDYMKETGESGDFFATMLSDQSNYKLASKLNLGSAWNGVTKKIADIVLSSGAGITQFVQELNKVINKTGSKKWSAFALLDDKYISIISEWLKINENLPTHKVDDTTELMNVVQIKNKVDPNNTQKIYELLSGSSEGKKLLSQNFKVSEALIELFGLTGLESGKWYNVGEIKTEEEIKKRGIEKIKQQEQEKKALDNLGAALKSMV